MAKQPASSPHVTGLAVWGYKSLCAKQHIKIAPLTILAGANSSGKSSMMQPLLLLKQTLEVGYDPGVLLLDGANARFSSVDQLFSKAGSKKACEEFGVRIERGTDSYLELHFGSVGSKALDVRQMISKDHNELTTLAPGMSHAEVVKAVPSAKRMFDIVTGQSKTRMELGVRRSRFMLQPVISPRDESDSAGPRAFYYGSEVGWREEDFIRSFVHLPGLRGNPLRSYPVTAIGNAFPGTFDAYTASMIAQWQTTSNKGKLEELAHDMLALGLTWKVQAKALNDTQVELLVGRLPKSIRGGAHDLVSIADVGFGVSQTLPVLVALHAARKGQTVYLEQPEIHLHPNAQLALATVLAAAVKRGVRLVVETHSSILLLGLQTLVADDKMEPSDIALHWFGRDPDTGWTKVTSAEMDHTGAFGDWPVDFGDIAMKAENAYLSAADRKLLLR